jgi:hypothetical protein
MSKKSIFYIVFFSVLVVVFYFTITSLVPAFAKKKITPVSYIRPFAFINQDGKTVTDKDVAGKVYVAEYFFTTCRGICPKMNNNMKQVYEKYKNENDFPYSFSYLRPGAGFGIATEKIFRFAWCEYFPLDVFDREKRQSLYHGKNKLYH